MNANTIVLQARECQRLQGGSRCRFKHVSGYLQLFFAVTDSIGASLIQYIGKSIEEDTQQARRCRNTPCPVLLPAADCYVCRFAPRAQPLPASPHQLSAVSLPNRALLQCLCHNQAPSCRAFPLVPETRLQCLLRCIASCGMLTWQRYTLARSVCSRAGAGWRSTSWHWRASLE